MRRAAAAARAAAASTSSSACVGTTVTREICAGPVPAAAGALQQARDALRAADLQHLVDRREVDAEVEARRADDRAQPPVAQAVLDPVAHVALERAVVQRDRAGPVGPRLEQRLVPDLRLRAHVGEDERRARALDRADHLRQQLRGRCVRPTGSARSSAGSALSISIVLASRPFDDAGAARRRARGPTRHASASSRLASVADSPHTDSAGLQAAQPRERQFGLHAALRRHELVPLVEDDGRHVREALAPVGARQHQRQALRRGDQRRRQPLRLLRAHATTTCRRCARRPSSAD